MIILDATTKSLEVSLDGAHATTALPYYAAYGDRTTSDYTPGNAGGATNGTTAVTAVAAPGASTTRHVKLLTVYNADTVPHQVTVTVNSNGTLRQHGAWVLQAGEQLTYSDARGFRICSAEGPRRQSQDANLITSPAMVVPGRAQRVLFNRYFPSGTTNPASGLAHWTYVGYVHSEIVVKHVEFYVTTGGTGAQTAEVALASGSWAPRRASSGRLTKIIADATLDNLTTTGIKRNTTPWSQSIPAGTHLWVGSRFAMATTNPQLASIGGDYQNGWYCSTASSADLTTLSTYNPGLLTLSTSVNMTDLRVTLD